MKKKLFIIIVISLFSFNSCDVLELNPRNAISEAIVWDDEQLVETYLNACYAKVYLYGFYRTNQLGIATDELWSGKGSVYYKYILNSTITSDWFSGFFHTYLNSWSNSYSYIRDVNVVFQKMEGSTLNDEFKNGVIGEMKFMRAFLYANLIWRYGGVPIITKVYELNEDYSVTRSSYDDCVNFIIDELDEAISLLPDKQTGSSLGKASADAARALKSRVLLYAASKLNNPSNTLSKWQAASDAAYELIQGSRYVLNSDYQSTFVEDNGENIFARYYTQSNSTEINTQLGRNGDNGWGSDGPTQNIVNSFEMAATGMLPYNEDGSVNITSGYDPNNPYVGRDPRFYATILHNSSVWMNRETETFYPGGWDTSEGPFASWNYNAAGYYVKKFLQEDVLPVGGTTKATNPWIMFRYAEILLNYAEAQFELGNEDTAREYINKVRSRAGVEMPEVTASGDELKKAIRQERKIELVFEGHRFFDVRRWEVGEEFNTPIYGVRITKAADGTLSYNFKYPLWSGIWNDKFYAMPIPYAEIDRSGGSLVQNPGF